MRKNYCTMKFQYSLATTEFITMTGNEAFALILAGVCCLCVMWNGAGLAAAATFD